MSLKNPSQHTLPTTMKAVLAQRYGDMQMAVHDGVAVPQLSDPYGPVTEPIHPLIRYATREDRKTHIIIKTLAVALAPGDYRVLSGDTREFQGPPHFPYIPGGDCCGRVVAVPDESETYFQPGDLVAARFTVAPRDGLAEYARVSATVCDKVPDGMSPTEAAVWASASPAVCLAEHVLAKKAAADDKQSSPRILILGASGGIGAHFVQMARQQVQEMGGYICAVSTKRDLLESYCDDIVDYTQQDIFQSKKYQAEPFDTIFDLAAGGWLKLVDEQHSSGKCIVKPATEGGRFITFTPDQPSFQGHGLLSLLGIFLFKPLWRALWTRLVTRRRLPTYTYTMGLPDTRDIMTQTLTQAIRCKWKAIMDGPYPFTTEGVREAFAKLQSRHARGKVVIEVAKE